MMKKKSLMITIILVSLVTFFVLGYRIFVIPNVKRDLATRPLLERDFYNEDVGEIHNLREAVSKQELDMSVWSEGMAILGQSKIGGYPDVPKSFEVPLDDKGNPLPFLMQFNVEDIMIDDYPDYLKQKGLVSVFIDMSRLDEISQENVWEYLKIYYFEDVEELISYTNYHSVLETYLLDPIGFDSYPSFTRFLKMYPEYEQNYDAYDYYDLEIENDWLAELPFFAYPVEYTIDADAFANSDHDGHDWELLFQFDEYSFWSTDYNFSSTNIPTFFIYVNSTEGFSHFKIVVEL